MNLLLAVLVVVVFARLLELWGIRNRTGKVLNQALAAYAILRDPELEDFEKEQRLQQYGLRLFRLSGVIAGLSALALLLPLGSIWLLERLGVSSLNGVLSILERGDFLLGVAVLGTAILTIRRLSNRA